MTKIRTERLHSPTIMEKAVAEIKKGKSIRAAAREFNIPLSTLRSRANGTYSLVMKKGPSTVLTPEIESNLVRWILYLDTVGYPPSKNSILNSVQLICNKMRKKTIFTNNRPSKSWYKSFVKRHEETLGSRTRQSLSKKNAAVNKKSMKRWFNEVGAHLKSKDLLDIDASRIFNLDESCFFLTPKTENIIVKKGHKSVNKLSTDNKEVVSALIACNAKGQIPPGYIMFRGAKFPPNIVKFLPSSFKPAKSANGWMTSSNFYDYIVNVFHPWCIEKDIIFPIILYVDGRNSQLTLPLSEFCAKNQIELISLFPSVNHLMQPVDIALLKPLREAYKNAVQEWRDEHNGASLNKENFGMVLSKALSFLDLEKILSEGFETCGLHPFRLDGNDFSKILNNYPDTHNLEKIIEMVTEESEEECNVKYIEDNIESDRLERFKEAKKLGVWNGPEEEKLLYEFWLKSCSRQTDKFSYRNLQQPTNLKSSSTSPDEKNKSVEGAHAPADSESKEIRDIKNEVDSTANKFILSYDPFHNIFPLNNCVPSYNK